MTACEPPGAEEWAHWWVCGSLSASAPVTSTSGLFVTLSFSCVSLEPFLSPCLPLSHCHSSRHLLSNYCVSLLIAVSPDTPKPCAADRSFCGSAAQVLLCLARGSLWQSPSHSGGGWMSDVSLLLHVASLPTGEPGFLAWQLRSPRKGREAFRPLKGLSLGLTQCHFH